MVIYMSIDVIELVNLKPCSKSSRKILRINLHILIRDLVLAHRQR